MIRFSITPRAMNPPPLDALDRKILDVLQADGRASNVDLSARVTCRRRSASGACARSRSAA
jgi:DNA-binding Lrp family transcriptional regulator